MEDFVPELWDKITQLFNERYNASGTIKDIVARIGSNASYSLAQEYARETSSILSGVLQNVLTADALPDGKLYYNIADRTIRPAMEGLREMVLNESIDVQRFINEAAGISFEPITPNADNSKIKNLIDRVSANNDREQSLEEVRFLFDENTMDGYAQSVVSDTLKANEEWQRGAGYFTQVRRYSASGCCEWCDSVSGTYVNGNTPPDFWRIHDNCNCEFDYRVGKKVSHIKYEYGTNAKGDRVIKKVTT